MDLLVMTGANTVVSVVKVRHKFNPVSVMRLEADGKQVPFLDGPSRLDSLDGSGAQMDM